MNKSIKFLLIALLSLAIIGMISYFSFMNAPKASSKGKKIELSIPATELFQAFEQDEAASNEKYMSKIIAVTGILQEMEEDRNGAPVLFLQTGEDFAGILCTLESSQKEKAAVLKMGDPVTVKGVCTGMLMEVVINKGILIDK